MSHARARAVIKPIAAVLLGVVFVAFSQASSTFEARSRTHKFRLKPAERCFMRKINSRRMRRGLARLHWDRQLAYVGRRHAKTLARAGGGVWHDSDLARRVTRWRSLGENTGRGRNCRSLFRALWRSSHHRANMLGRWSFMGVGIGRRRGHIYVQQIFENRSNPGNIYSYP